MFTRSLVRGDIWTYTMALHTQRYFEQRSCTAFGGGCRGRQSDRAAAYDSTEPHGARLQVNRLL